MELANGWWKKYIKIRNIVILVFTSVKQAIIIF